MTPQEKELIGKEAVSRWGDRFNLDMIVEECAELIQAINKLKRAGGIDHCGNVIHPTVTSSREYSLTYYALCSEVADVENLIGIAKIILNKEAIELSSDRKMERLKQRFL